MSKRTIIGVTVCTKPDGIIDFQGPEYLYLRREYMHAIKAAGATPLLLTPDMTPEAAAELCDGIVISGGYDVPVELYDGQHHESMQHIESMERAGWEMALIDVCDEIDKPILGVCYGLHLLNVRYGGTLYQDIPSQFHGAGTHAQGTPVDEHIVTFSQDFLGYNAGESAPSAARHHQAVDKVADGWEVVARTSDGVIEAMRGGRHYGVQWHPESDDTAIRIYGSFVTTCVGESAVSHVTL